MNDFKPGDVVVHPKYGRGIVQDSIVEWAAHVDYSVLRKVAADLRRLVVIDAEDREQVERLRGLYVAEAVERGAMHPQFAGQDELRRDAMQAALREFADPKPPRIDEPGTWGVVEAACVHSDRRLSWMKHEDGNWWPFAPYGTADRRPMPDDWDSLVDPVLIREGVQP